MSDKIVKKAFSAVSRIVRFLFLPVVREPRFFLFLYISNLLLAALLLVLDVNDSLFLSFFCAHADCYVLTVLGWLGGRWVRRTIAALYVVLLLSEVYLALGYGGMINPQMIGLVLQTNERESEEFLSLLFSSAVFWKSILLTAAIILVAGVLLPYALRKAKNSLPHLAHDRRFQIGKKAFLGVLLIVLVSSGVRQLNYYLRCVAMSMSENVHGILEYSIKSVTPWIRIYYSFACHKLYSKEMPMLEETLRHVKVESCSFKSPVILLVIGESYSKHFCPVYNRKALPATPRTCQRVRQGDIVAFDDVVTPYNMTAEFFKQSFSLASVGSERPWTDYSTFPAVFKKAGYEVDFISNQFIKERNNNGAHDQVGGAIFNYGKLSDMQFTMRNAALTEFDGGLISQIPLSSVSSGRPTLVIVHLLGQHFHYEMRHPKWHTPFSISDIPTCPGGEEGREARMHYTNAVHYNDSVVNAIFDLFEPYETIGIYLSDHGEEVYDYRSFYCRSQEPQITVPVAKYQYEVPFFIYMSHRYQEAHPDVVDRVRKACHLPFMTDDLSHLLIDMAGIDCEDFDRTKSPVSSSYNASRKRLLWGRTDYDQLMKE